MKKLFLMAIMLLMFGAANAQIADVQQKGSYLYVYGDGNLQKICFSISVYQKIYILYI